MVSLLVLTANNALRPLSNSSSRRCSLSYVHKAGIQYTRYEIVFRRCWCTWALCFWRVPDYLLLVRGPFALGSWEGPSGPAGRPVALDGRGTQRPSAKPGELQRVFHTALLLCAVCCRTLCGPDRQARFHYWQARFHWWYL